MQEKSERTRKARELREERLRRARVAIPVSRIIQGPIMIGNVDPGWRHMLLQSLFNLACRRVERTYEDIHGDIEKLLDVLRERLFRQLRAREDPLRVTAWFLAFVEQQDMLDTRRRTGTTRNEGRRINGIACGRRSARRRVLNHGGSARTRVESADDEHPGRDRSEARAIPRATLPLPSWVNDEWIDGRARERGLEPEPGTDDDGTPRMDVFGPDGSFLATYRAEGDGYRRVMGGAS